MPDTDALSDALDRWKAGIDALAGDLVRVHAVLRDGLADPSHAAFAAKLAVTGLEHLPHAPSADLVEQEVIPQHKSAGSTGR